MINNYHNILYKISLNWPYHAALYKKDIEIIDIELDEYEDNLYTFSFEDDFNNYKEIIKELGDLKVNINDYKITDLHTDTAVTLEQLKIMKSVLMNKKVYY